ncbi:MAG: HEAT repeat domain-containing protein, partial [Nitrospira sp.]|nr:HEAT repeat domain-containing protein [Nitrospira sp.]
WHETLGLLAGLMKDPIPLLQAIINEKDDIFSGLLLLAGRCIAECEEKEHPLITEILDKIYRLWRDYPFLGFIRSIPVVLGQTYSQMLERLQEALQDKSNSMRWSAAAGILGKIGSEQAIEALIQALHDEDSDIRGLAAWALGRIGNKRAVVALIQALHHADSDVRWSATEVLGEIGSEQAIEALIQALYHEDRFVRWLAAWVLGKIESEQAVEGLIQALHDEDSDIRWLAAEALGKIDNEQAVSILIQALSDRDYDVRGQAAKALGEIGSEQAVSALIQALNDEASSVRKQATEVLGKIGTLETLKKLIQLPEINIYDADIFSLARKLAVRFSKKKVPFIPVYPELIRKKHDSEG